MSKRKNNTPVSVLYEKMIDACSKSDFLHYHDEITAMQKKVRIFTYSHDIPLEDWNIPLAKEFKGITFEMEDDRPVGILCRPMVKIFNIPKDLKSMDIDYVTMKMDGSLVSSYVDDGYPSLKSEESLYSDVAILASSLLNSDAYRSLREHIASHVGFTYNFEYTSPQNCIVLNYERPKLTLLSIRDNATGEDIPIKQLFADSVLRQHLVEWVEVDSHKLKELLDDVKTSEATEGIVITTKDSKQFKVKSDWYNSVHQLKDCVLHPEHLIYYVSEGETDELRDAFKNQQEALDRIEIFEETFRRLLRNTLGKVEVFYRENHGLDKNSYSANAMMETTRYPDSEYLYPCFMSCYGGLDFDSTIEILKDYYVRNYKDLIQPEFINL